MYILIALMLLAPALIGVLFYERFKGYELIMRKRIELLVSFAFVINLIVYAAFWLRGWQQLIWMLVIESHVVTTAFIFQYMAIALAAAVIIAYIFSLVKISKALGSLAKDDAQDEDAAASSQDGESISSVNEAGQQES